MLLKKLSQINIGNVILLSGTSVVVFLILIRLLSATVH